MIGSRSGGSRVREKMGGEFDGFFPVHTEFNAYWKKYIEELCHFSFFSMNLQVTPRCP